MALTAEVKDELASIQSGKTTIRAAELATILRFSGGLHVISGRIAVESEVDTEQLARRVRKDIAELYGVRADVSVISASGVRRASHYLVRVLDGGETLARQTGLLDARRRPIRGLPNRLTTGSREELAAVWRGAFLAAGTLTDRADPLPSRSPAPATRPPWRLWVPRAGSRLQRRPAKCAACTALSCATVRRSARCSCSWAPSAAWRRGTRCASAERCARRRNRLVNFDDANLRRSAQAAVAACARVERALEILDGDVPKHLQYAGELRLRFRDSSLDELGHHADPPMTKDAVAGRIRRLLAMADKRASDLGIPGTDANLPPDLDE